MTYGLDGGNIPGCNGAVQVEQLYTGRWRAEHIDRAWRSDLVFHFGISLQGSWTNQAAALESAAGR